MAFFQVFLVALVVCAQGLLSQPGWPGGSGPSGASPAGGYSGYSAPSQGQAFRRQSSYSSYASSSSTMSNHGAATYADHEEQFDSTGSQGQDGNVHIRFWTGRAGNNVKQLINAVVLAEATGRRKVCLPLKIYGDTPLSEVFNVPSGGECLSIKENGAVQNRVRCEPSYYERTVRGHLKIIEENLFESPCVENLQADDFKNAMIKYLKPLATNETKDACALEGTGFEGLTIHLRSGDLLEKGASYMLQSHFAPCAYHMSVIKDKRFNFKKVRIITEADMEHPCIEYIKDNLSNNSDIQVRLQAGSMAQDVCALMNAHNVLHSSVSTFSMHFGWVMNEKLKNTFWPFKQVVPGFQGDECGQSTLSNSTCNRRTFLYDIAAMGQDRRTFKEKAMYLRTASSASVSLHHAECHPCRPSF